MDRQTDVGLPSPIPMRDGSIPSFELGRILDKISGMEFEDNQLLHTDGWSRRRTWDDKIGSLWYSYGLNVFKELEMKRVLSESVLPIFEHHDISFPNNQIQFANWCTDYKTVATICYCLHGLPVELPHPQSMPSSRSFSFTKEETSLTSIQSLMDEFEDAGRIRRRLDTFLAFLRGESCKALPRASLELDTDITPSDGSESDWWVDTDDEDNETAVNQFQQKEKRGLISDAFCESVHYLLQEHSSCLNEIMAASRKNTEEARRPSLLALYLNTKQLTQKLEILARICWSTGEGHSSHGSEEEQWRSFPRGCQLLDYLYNLLEVAESRPQEAVVLHVLFECSCAPLVAFLQSWLLQESPIDPFHEFMDDNGCLSASLPRFMDSVALKTAHVGQQVAVIQKLPAGRRMVQKLADLWGPFFCFSAMGEGSFSVRLDIVQMGAMERKRVTKGMAAQALVRAETKAAAGNGSHGSEVSVPGEEASCSGRPFLEPEIRPRADLVPSWKETRISTKEDLQNVLRGPSPADVKFWVSEIESMALVAPKHVSDCLESSRKLPYVPISVAMERCMLQEVSLWCEVVNVLHSNIFETLLPLHGQLSDLRAFFCMEDASWTSEFLTRLLDAFQPTWSLNKSDLHKILPEPPMEPWSENGSHGSLSLQFQSTAERTVLIRFNVESLKRLQLRYFLEGPTTSILNETIMDQFSAIFSSLLVLQSARISLQSATSSLKELDRVSRQETDKTMTLRKVHSLKHAMLHYVSGLLSWTHTTVIHVPTLKERTNRGGSRTVSESVEEFIDESMAACLLSDKYKMLRAVVDDMAQLVIDFCLTVRAHRVTEAMLVLCRTQFDSLVYKLTVSVLSHSELRGLWAMLGQNNWCREIH